VGARLPEKNFSFPPSFSLAKKKFGHQNWADVNKVKILKGSCAIAKFFSLSHCNSCAMFEV